MDFGKSHRGAFVTFWARPIVFPTSCRPWFSQPSIVSTLLKPFIVYFRRTTILLLNAIISSLQPSLPPSSFAQILIPSPILDVSLPYPSLPSSSFVQIRLPLIGYTVSSPPSLSLLSFLRTWFPYPSLYPTISSFCLISRIQRFESITALSFLSRSLDQD